MRLLLVLLLIAVPVQAEETNWTPKPNEVARLEKKLVLPHGARPLADYARYYWGETEAGAKRIRGALVFGQQIGVHVTGRPVSQKITDQGCNWIYVQFDPVADKVSAQCDGIG